MMSSEVWRQISHACESYFGAPDDERSAFLEKLRLSNPGVAEQLEALLSLHALPTSARDQVSLRDCNSPNIPVEETQSETFADSKPASSPTAAELFAKRIGRYLVEGVLGQGGFGVVYMAYDAQLQRRVAIKIPHAKRAAKTKDDMYLAEARMAAKLDHPNIASVYEVGRTENGLVYIVSRYIEGSDLAKHIETNRPSFIESAQLIAAIAEALHYAHKKGLVHRDVKPGNILLDCDGKPFLVDFGLALKDEDFGKSALMIGTPAYMSPEQSSWQSHHVDGRSDVFSLGVVFYELLTGRRPFRAENLDELLEKIRLVDPAPPRQKNDRVPRELERICLKALEKRPLDRYLTAQDMADDIRGFLAMDETKTNTASSRDESGYIPRQDSTQRKTADDFPQPLLLSSRDHEKANRVKLESGFRLGRLGCSIRMVITLVVLLLIGPTFLIVHSVKHTPDRQNTDTVREPDISEELTKLKATVVVNANDQIIAVNADDTEIEDSHLRQLSTEDQIEKLSLQRTRITDVGFSYLYNLENLREINLTGAHVSASGVSELKEKLPNCTVIWRP